MAKGFRKSDGKSNAQDPSWRAVNRMDRETWLEGCRRGGRNSAKTRSRKRLLKDIAKAMLECDLPTEDLVRAALEARGLETTEGAALLFAQLNKAKAGDTEAARFIRDTSGQKPVDNVAIGNLDDKPFESLDLASLTDDQLRALAEEEPVE